MLKKLISMAAMAVAGLTAACEEGPATIPVGYRSPALWSSMVYATSAGPMYVEILGNPFNVSEALLGEALTSFMDNKLIGREIRFTPMMGQAPQSHLRIILALNPPKSLSSKQLCEGRAGSWDSAMGPDGKLRILATFCNTIDRESLHTVTGWAKVDGLEHPRLPQLMGQVDRDLFGSPN